MEITVVGSGRWGSAVAIYCCNIGHKVNLFCTREKGYYFIKKNGYSQHLKEYPFTKSLQLLSNQDSLPTNNELVIFSIPVPFFRDCLDNLKGITAKQILLTINKGIEQKSLKLPYKILEEYYPNNKVAHLGGPCFPSGLLEKKPVAETLACLNKDIGAYLQKNLSSTYFRIYKSLDIKGTSFLGAIKNVFAIIAGIIEGLQLGEEALAILITRGIYETKKFCKILQIPEITLYGMSGLGDLVLTCYAKTSSQNRKFGYEISKKPVDQVISSLNGKIAEGYFTTKALYSIAKNNSIDAPLTNAAYQVLYQKVPILKAIQQLIARPLKSED